MVRVTKLPIIMKKYIIICLFPAFFFQCSYNASRKSDNTENKTIVDEDSSVEKDVVDHEINSDNLSKICNCNWQPYQFNYYADLTFSNNFHPFHVDSLAKWKNNNERLKIKSLLLIDFDTIPKEMSIFENVEAVYLRSVNHHNVQGLEIFPQLKFLKAEEERFELTENTRWLAGIEVIDVNKTKFTGIKSFKQIPNLKECRMSFSGFDYFPADFESLKCLSYFQTGAHTFGNIDLAQLDLTNMPCLKYVEFHSWNDNISGIPKGTNHIKTVKIKYPKMKK